MGDDCSTKLGPSSIGLVGLSKDDSTRVKLTEVNPHLVCVLCHGYFVDATTITECLHSFCRSCIFRHLEKKSICPICEVPVHTRLHRSLKPDKTLQDIVYKLVPGLFHNEMERRRSFYKQHPFRDEHLEPERRGLGLDRLIYSPTDTISLSLEFYDTEREREEWSSVTCPPPHSESQECSSLVSNSSSSNNNNNKRYLQCPAIFKMAHLKKFLRQKYNLPPTANVEIIYKREFLPDSYSLMDVAYIYTWKRNGPMRFYYRIPDEIDNNTTYNGKLAHEKTEKMKNPSKLPPPIPLSTSPKSDLERNKQVLSAANIPVETEEKKLPPAQLKKEGSMEVKNMKDNKNANVKPILEPSQPVLPKPVNNSEKSVNQSKTTSLEEKKLTQVPESKPAQSVEDLQNTKVPPPSLPLENTSNIPPVPKVPKQDQLPVEVLLSLSTCRVATEAQPNNDALKEPKQKSQVKELSKSNTTHKSKQSNNARMSLNKIASELHQKAANNFIQKTITKENSQIPLSSTNLSPAVKLGPNGKSPYTVKNNGNSPNNINGRLNGNKRKPHMTAVPGRQIFNEVGVMDHRIQQLYKFPGSPSSNNSPANGVVPVGQKTESRLANWLNNRFQSKPPGSPAHPGSTSPAHPGSASPARLVSDSPARLGSGSPARLGSDSPARFGSDSPAHPGSTSPARLGSASPAHPALASPASPAQPGSANPSFSAFPNLSKHFLSSSSHSGTPTHSARSPHPNAISSTRISHPSSPVNSGITPPVNSLLSSNPNIRANSGHPASPVNPNFKSSAVPHPLLPNNLTESTKLNGINSEKSGEKSPIQNFISSTTKSTHPNMPPHISSYNKVHSQVNNTVKTSPNSKKFLPEKREVSNEAPVPLSHSSSVKNGLDKKGAGSPISRAATSPIQITNSPSELVNGSSKPTKSTSPPVSIKMSPKNDDKSKAPKSFNSIINVPSVGNLIKDKGSIVKEPATLSGSIKVPKSSSPVLDKTLLPPQEDVKVNCENIKASPPVPPVPVGGQKKDIDSKQESKNQEENKEEPNKLDEEVNRLKRKLEEMRKMSNVKGKEIGGCQITHENPDPEEVKRRRDLTPVVSIELLRGCKRPVPGLKAIQDIVDLGKRKDEKKEVPEKKLKISSVKKDVGKKDDPCALDLSRCAPPNPSTPPHPWFNPLLHQQFLPSSK